MSGCFFCFLMGDVISESGMCWGNWGGCVFCVVITGILVLRIMRIVDSCGKRLPFGCLLRNLDFTKKMEVWGYRRTKKLRKVYDRYELCY